MIVDIPGQPPSLNHNYRIIRIKHRDGTSHQQLGKLKDVESYQLIVTSLTRRALPPGYIPPDRQIRVRYRFYLKRDIDCDNALKAINDALAIGLGVNDKLFLPCVESKETGYSDPHTEIEID